MKLRKPARVIAVVGIVAGTTFAFGTTSRANHVIEFTECSDAQQSPGPEPTLTPPPVDGGEPTPPPGPESTPAPQNCMPAQGDRIWGGRKLQFTINEGSYNVTNVTLSILSSEENIPSANEGQPVATWGEADVDEETPLTFDWNSFQATPYNGIYKIVATANAKRVTFGQRDHTATAQRVNLRVDNAPNPVQPPKVIATTLGSVTIEWPRATEPDVTAYTVYRATSESKSVRPSYADFKQVGITSGNAYRDSTVQPGIYWYAVRVTRRSVVTPEVGISSPVSNMSGAAEVQSPKAPPKKTDGKGVEDDPPTRYIPRYRQLAPPRPRTVARALPDAPFAYKLPYDDEAKADFGAVETGVDEGPTDPRGAVLPVAVGMFLVSSALAVGRMPY
jgi:hypothetical protein